ncbi:cytochrome-c oxidase, cbb3-type subunit III [Limimaricola sp.]|uniref:cytochrome-c oxidase, cbb3-type subunit III n=1 Tax=Limimaricola sp. TaxID=2211665 RepID=UPI0040585BED
MSVKDRDPLTGHQTTGHEWDGITELNTRVPRAVWIAIIVTHLWALAIWILLPAWPLVSSYTGGLLGLDQQDEVEAEILRAGLARGDWLSAIDQLPVAEIRADPELAARVAATAPALFGDNCAACHGAQATGGPGFPSLVDEAWLWGGDAEAVMETLRVGINAGHPDTRYAQMLAFGRDGILSRGEIRSVTGYVQSLSGAEIAPDTRAAGSAIFADNCASCHGAEGRGNTDIGAPDLTDAFWIHGGDATSIYRTIRDGRQGLMPAWEDRLSRTDRKMLTVYLQQLAGEGAP